MASNLSLQVILSLVDKLTGPMKQATGELDHLGKEAKTAGDELGRPVWTDHERTLGKISESTANWSQALGGAANAAQDIEDTLRQPTWVEHGRNVVKAAEAAHSYRQAMGGVGTAVSAVPVAPIKEQADAIDKATGRVKEHEEGLKQATKATKDHAAAVQTVGGTWEQIQQMGAASIGATTGLGLVRKTIEAGAERQHAEVAMGTAGMTDAERNEFKAEALRDTARYPTHSQTEIEVMLTRVRAQTGSAEHALMAIGPLLEAKTVIQAEAPAAAEGFDQVTVGLEVAGAMRDEATLRKYLDLMTRAMEVNKGTIRPEDYKEYFQQLRSQYAQKLDPEFLKGPASVLMNEMGGSSAGTAQNSFENEVYRSTMYGRTAERFEKLGLLPDKSKIHRAKGHIKYLDPGALKDWQLAESNPDRWLNEVVWPAIQAGVKGADEQQALFNSLWQTPTSSGFANMLVNQRWRTQRDTALINAAPGLAAFQTWLQQDTGTAFQGALTQGGNILAGGGMPFMPSLLGDAKGAIGALSWWNQMTAEHQAVNAIGLSGIALAGAGIAAAALKEGGPWAVVKGALKGAGSLAIAYTAKELLDVADPKGNLWGLTSGVDEYVKRRWGWNPSNVFEPVKPPEGAAYDPLLDPNSSRNVGRTRKSLWKAGYLTWDHWHGYRDTGELDQEEDRESRRAAAASPHAMEAVGATVDVLNQKAKEAADQLHALDQPIAPKIDTSGLERAAALLREMAVQIGIINGGISGMRGIPAGAGGARGAPLHDGPEAR